MSTPEPTSQEATKPKAPSRRRTGAPQKRKPPVAPPPPGISTLLIRWAAVCGIVAAAIWLLFSTPARSGARDSHNAWAGESE